MARARTHGGIAVWMAVRFTLPTTAQPAPARPRAMHTTIVLDDSATAATPSVYSIADTMPTAFIDHLRRKRTAATAPTTAPVPRQPSSKP